MRRRELRVRQVFRQDRMRRRGHERLASDQAGVVRETHIDEPSIWLVAHISICIVVTAIKPGQSQQNKTDMVNLAQFSVEKEVFSHHHRQHFFQSIIQSKRPLRSLSEWRVVVWVAFLPFSSFVELSSRPAATNLVLLLFFHNIQVSSLFTYPPISSVIAGVLRWGRRGKVWLGLVFSVRLHTPFQPLARLPPSYATIADLYLSPQEVKLQPFEGIYPSFARHSRCDKLSSVCANPFQSYQLADP